MSGDDFARLLSIDHSAVTIGIEGRLDTILLLPR